METLLFIFNILLLGVGTALVAYIVIMGASSEVEKELFDEPNDLSRKATENVDFFFSGKENN